MSQPISSVLILLDPMRTGAFHMSIQLTGGYASSFPARVQHRLVCLEDGGMNRARKPRFLCGRGGRFFRLQAAGRPERVATQHANPTASRPPISPAFSRID